MFRTEEFNMKRRATGDGFIFIYRRNFLNTRATLPSMEMHESPQSLVEGVKVAFATNCEA